MNEDIQRELAIVDRDNPWYLRHFQTLMHEGEVDGRYYGGSESQRCGCFYGWLADLEINGAERAQEQVIEELYDKTGHHYVLTPIETLIAAVRPGETSKGWDEGSQALRELDQEIEEYFTHKEVSHA